MLGFGRERDDLARLHEGLHRHASGQGRDPSRELSASMLLGADLLAEGTVGDLESPHRPPPALGILLGRVPVHLFQCLKGALGLRQLFPQDPCARDSARYG
jgi:hypothetical protein